VIIYFQFYIKLFGELTSPWII